MSLHGNIVTAQTSSTGNVLGNNGRLVGVFVSINSTTGGGTLALLDSTGTTAGTTRLTLKFAPAIRNDWVPIPSDGILFTRGITVSSILGLTSVTLSFQ